MNRKVEDASFLTCGLQVTFRITPQIIISKVKDSSIVFNSTKTLNIYAVCREDKSGYMIQPVVMLTIQGFGNH